MGWWSQDEQGHSFAQAEGEDMLWGDEPADILDNAIDAITVSFQAAHGRRPTRSELLAGMKFSLGGDRFEEAP
jgi:hypothetical protein